MAKKLLGIDIGTGCIKLVDGEHCVILDTPDNVFDGDTFIAYDGMSEVIRDALKENGIRTKKCAIVLPDNEIYFNKITMPFMTEKQLRVNLPYEFTNVVGNDADSYLYDYAVIRYITDASGSPKDMELLAAACTKKLIDKYTEMCKKAGLKLVKALPRRLAISAILTEKQGDIALVELGYNHTRIDMYHDGMYDTGRSIDVGVSHLLDIVSEVLFCDKHIALSYLKNNKDDVIHHSKMQDSYDYIATEIMRAINFYTYENRDNTLESLFFYGGGYHIEPFVQAIRDAVSLKVSPISSDEDVMNALVAYGACEE